MITLEKKGPIAILTLNRPDAMNALGEPGDGEAVRDACAQINKDHSIRAAVLTGAGKGFSAGGNVKAMRSRIALTLPPTPPRSATTTRTAST